MTTTYPFQLRNELVGRLPPPDADRRHYIDVKVHGDWEGILVVDSAGICSGIYVRRRVKELPLPFDISQIEDVRSACRWNRMLAQIPFDLYTSSLIVVFLVSPVLLAFAATIFPPLAIVSSAACLFALFFMYQIRAFPFMRPLAALFGLAQIIFGTTVFIPWISG